MTTKEELNAELVKEFQRLGDRGPIDTVLREKFNTTSITTLDPSQYDDLLAAVRAL